MPFLTEPEPTRGLAFEIVPGIRRIVAPNPSLMTYHGTNTYLIATERGTVVLDPGPDDAGHVAAIVEASEGRVAAILLSHTHSDHLGAVAALKARTGALSHGFHRSADPAFVPDVPLKHFDEVAGMVCLHTPGHASDHLCFARPDGIIFSADHVMTWSSSIVSPPGGDMAAYVSSLGLLLGRTERLLLPGHGPPMRDPRHYIGDLLDHRIKREETIVEALGDGPLGSRDLVDRLYSQTHPLLRLAAERNVVAHLFKLETEGRVGRHGELWVARK